MTQEQQGECQLFKVNAVAPGKINRILIGQSCVPFFPFYQEYLFCAFC